MTWCKGAIVLVSGCYGGTLAIVLDLLGFISIQGIIYWFLGEKKADHIGNCLAISLTILMVGISGALRLYYYELESIAPFRCHAKLIYNSGEESYPDVIWDCGKFGKAESRDTIDTIAASQVNVNYLWIRRWDNNTYYGWRSRVGMSAKKKYAGEKDLHF